MRSCCSGRFSPGVAVRSRTWAVAFGESAACGEQPDPLRFGLRFGYGRRTFAREMKTDTDITKLPSTNESLPDDGVASLIVEVRNLIQSARRSAATTVNTLQVLPISRLA